MVMPKEENCVDVWSQEGQQASDNRRTDLLFCISFEAGSQKLPSICHVQKKREQLTPKASKAVWHRHICVDRIHLK